MNKYFSWFPDDEVLAAFFGLSEQWKNMEPYQAYLGYLFWYCVAVIFFLFEVFLPKIPTAFLLAAAIITGVTIKLAEVYAWGHFSFGEQITMYLLFSIVTFVVWFFLRPGRRRAVRIDDRDTVEG